MMYLTSEAVKGRTPRNVISGELFRLGIRPLRWRDSHRLKKFPIMRFSSLCTRLGEFNKACPFSTFSIDPHHKISGIDFIALDNNFLSQQVSGKHLDLTGLELKLARYKASGAGRSFRTEVVVQIVHSQDSLPSFAMQPADRASQGVSSALILRRPQAQESYLFESRLIKLKRRNRDGAVRNFSIETLSNPAERLHAKSEDIVSDLSRVFMASLRDKVNGEFDESRIREFMRSHYFERSKKLAVIRHEGIVVGFSVLTREVVDLEEIILISGTYLDPAAKGMRFSGILNYFLLREIYKEIGGGFSVVARTASPLVLGSMMTLSSHFPDPGNLNARPSERALRIVRTISARVSPEIPLDESTFISQGAFNAAFGVTYDQTRLDLHLDPSVNAYCRRLDYDRGDAVFIYGEYTPLFPFKFIGLDLYRRGKRGSDAMVRGLLKKALFHG